MQKLCWRQLKNGFPSRTPHFLDYRVGAAHVSSKGLKIVKNMIGGKQVSYEESGLSKREWNELMETLELKDKLFNFIYIYKLMKQITIIGPCYNESENIDEYLKESLKL